MRVVDKIGEALRAQQHQQIAHIALHIDIAQAPAEKLLAAAVLLRGGVEAGLDVLVAGLGVFQPGNGVVEGGAALLEIVLGIVQLLGQIAFALVQRIQAALLIVQLVLGRAQVAAQRARVLAPGCGPGADPEQGQQ